MVSTIPSYVYSLFAALIVGTILVSSISLSMVNVKNKAQNQELTNVDNYVATQILTLFAHTTCENQSVKQLLSIPTQIGNQRFWFAIENDSSGTWVKSGFGTTVNVTQLQVSVPAEIDASGSFVSGAGRAFLQCSEENQMVIVKLTCE